MKKKIIIIITIIITVILLTIGGIFIYNKWRIANAKIIVELQDNLKIDVFSEIKLSDLIKSINGKLKDDYKINTTKVGVKPIKFNYTNDDNIDVSYSFEIEIVDQVPPVIFSLKSLSVQKGYNDNLAKELFCGDNYDDKPKCEIEGTYDGNKPGTYKLKFIGTDSSNNKSENEFDLIVKGSDSGSPTPPTYQNSIFPI